MSATGGDMDAVFKALADPSRRRMLDSLNARRGQNLMQLCEGLDMARQSVSKHLAVLEAANLVTTVRRGREKLHYLNAAPINEIEQRWINQYDRGRIQALGELKAALEGTTVESNEFVYTTYINSTPEKVWQGLTDPAFTRRYWNVEFETDWNVGSPITWEIRGVTIADPEQRVLEYDPYRRLSYTWHTVTPEFAAVIGLDDERRAKLAAEKRSRVAFDIEPVDSVSKLTVIHEFLEPNTVMSGMVSQGWPRVIAELKTLLETGDVLTR
jgi:uncharacterized protein YndB with AHSA1/START domain/DNA-binding transcriptional ArsR family regulator